MSLMYMLHFSQSIEVNACVKQLLVSFHGGCLWLDQKYSMDIELIATIIGLPLTNVESTPYFKKYQDTLMTNKLKDKYYLTKDTNGFLIASINDHIVCLVHN